MGFKKTKADVSILRQVLFTIFSWSSFQLVTLNFLSKLEKFQVILAFIKDFSQIFILTSKGHIIVVWLRFSGEM